jgi:5-methyltetrahydrofolate--homocysteine methyltransferase
MRRTLEAFRDAGLHAFKTLIGGAPVTPRFAEEIGADGYAADAASAVDLARTLLKTISG